MCVAPKFGQAGRAPVAASSRFAARNGKCASRGAGLQGAARIVAGRARAGGRPHRPEVEVVVADRRGVDLQRVVRADHGRALGQVRLQRSLEHVARVEEDDAAAVLGPLPSEIRDVPAEARERLDVTVQIVDADDRDRDVLGRVGLMGARVRRAGARWRRNQQQRSDDHRAGI
jgi:hypothetical protein